MEKSNVTSFPKEKVSKEKLNIQNSLSPREIVSELDRFVVGQNNAKRAQDPPTNRTRESTGRDMGVFEVLEQVAKLQTPK